MYWKQLSHEQIKARIEEALKQNLNYRTNDVLGLPATFLDREEFYEDAPFLEDAPFMKALVENPNNIGCHTLSEGEHAFKGTQILEKELIKLCAEQIFLGEEDAQDGYVASGGTEANIEAMWVYRNYYMQAHGASLDQIGVFFSEDSHYSIPKGINLLQLQGYMMKVEYETRAIDLEALQAQLQEAKAAGIKYMIVYINMATTMFGSVDDLESMAPLLDNSGMEYKIHVDGAFGGFIYPFSNSDNPLTFQNPRISSFTLDAHKMLQAPYGTGIFLIRKGFMHYVCTEEAQYVNGKDYTLIGSRSGANAVAVWMIMSIYGSEGWKYKISRLVERTSRLCARLDKLGISYFREPHMNIVTIKASDIPSKIAERFYLVPDTHEGEPKWWKIVVMDHVTQGALDRFIDAVKAQFARVQN
jgi:tyrosine decarboxylase / aspartate 1-decarboxylase